MESVRKLDDVLRAGPVDARPWREGNPWPLGVRDSG
jgi:hypothetical protein